MLSPIVAVLLISVTVFVTGCAAEQSFQQRGNQFDVRTLSKKSVSVPTVALTYAEEEFNLLNVSLRDRLDKINFDIIGDCDGTPTTSYPVEDYPIATSPTLEPGLTAACVNPNVKIIGITFEHRDVDGNVEVIPPMNEDVTYTTSAGSQLRLRRVSAVGLIAIYEIVEMKIATASAGATVDIDNRPPVAVNDFTTAETGVSTPINVLSNDYDPDMETVEPKNFTNPSHGDVVKAGDGRFWYTATGGYTGPDQFTYDVIDSFGNLSAIATVDIIVNPGGGSPPIIGGGNDPVTSYDIAMNHGSDAMLIQKTGATGKVETKHWNGMNWSSSGLARDNCVDTGGVRIEALGALRYVAAFTCGATVFGAYYNGTSWAESDITGTTAGNPQNLDMSANASGETVVTWDDGNDVYAAYFSSSHIWTPGERVSEGGGN